MPALIALALQYMPQLIQASASIPTLIGYIKKLHETAQQSGEMTLEQEAQFDQYLKELKEKPEWQVTP